MNHTVPPDENTPSNPQTPGHALKITPTPWYKTFWGSFFAVIAVLAVIAIWSEFRAYRQLQNAATSGQAPLARFTTTAYELFVSPEKARLLVGDFSDKVNAFKKTSTVNIDRLIDKELKRIFDLSIRRIPTFADWYYSVGGEYSRIFSTFSGDIGEYTVGKMKEVMLDPVQFEQKLDGVPTSVNQLIANHIAQLRADMMETVASLSKVPGPIVALDENAKVVASHDLDGLFQQKLLLNEADITRLSASIFATAGFAMGTKSAIGATTITSLFPKIASKKIVQIAMAALGKLAMKVGVKSAAASAGGATGLLCGPLVVVCGPVAAIAAWVAADYAFASLEETVNREEFEREMRSAFIQQRDELSAKLKKAYVQLMDEQCQALEQQLQQIPIPQQDFVPATSIK